MAGAQVTTVDAVMIEKQRLGYQAVSLTHPDDGVAPAIAAGSKHETGGALFEYTVDEAIGSLAGIANSSEIFIKTTVAGAAITVSGTITAPTWSTSKQGWYIGTDRVLGGMYKDSGGNYGRKWLYEDKQVNSIKRYLDGTIDLFPGEEAAGTTTAMHADTERTKTGAGYTKVKEILCPFKGTLRIEFDLKTGNALGAAYGRVYKNGSAYGTERSTSSTGYVTYTQDLTFDKGDLIQLYYHDTGGWVVYVRNLQVKVASSNSILRQLFQTGMVTLD